MVRLCSPIAPWRRPCDDEPIVEKLQTPLFYMVDWLPPDFGAVGQYGQLFAREMAEKENRKILLIGLTGGPSSVERGVLVGGGQLDIFRLSADPYEKGRVVKRLFWTIRTNFRLLREVMRNPASHGAEVLFTGAPPFMLFFAVPLKFIRKVRLIYRITDLYPEVIIAELGRRGILLGLLQGFGLVLATASGFVPGAWGGPASNPSERRNCGCADIDQTRLLACCMDWQRKAVTFASRIHRAQNLIIFWKLRISARDRYRSRRSNSPSPKRQWSVRALVECIGSKC